MSKNILVIGNGYDLAHGLNTKYDDFIKFIKDKAYDKYPDNENAAKIKRIVGNEKNGFINYFLAYTNEVPGWVDLERLIKEIIEQFQTLFVNYHHYVSGGIFVSTKMTSALFDVLMKFKMVKNETTRGSEKNFLIEEYSEKYGLAKQGIIKKLRKELDNLIDALEAYFMLELEVNPIESKAAIRQIAEINPKYVISFNYTNLYKLYGINEEDVYHVHGKLGSKPNNMVLGFNDDDPENLDFIYFEKYFQRIQKWTGYINDERFSYKDESGVTHRGGMIVHFYGHSMDETDKDLIQKIDSLSKKLVIYYLNQEDYEKKVINLIKIFGKDVATKNIQVGKFEFVKCEEPKQNMKE